MPGAAIVGDAPRYFPPDNGRYEIKPGLRRPNNDPFDHKVFQIDSSFAHYRQAKLAARSESLEKYYQTCRYAPAVAGTIARFVAECLVREHGASFVAEESGDRLALHCKLSGEILHLDENGALQWVEGAAVEPPYASALDALSAQVQEDLAVVCRDRDGKDWVAAIHLCHANHWAAAEKIGRSFAQVHAPVAGMEKINARANAMVHAMIDRSPYVRFAWGLGTDARLNHHPQAPDGVDAKAWQGRHFAPDDPQLYMRVERQVIWGFPQVNAALFTIRTYFYDCAPMRRDKVMREKLCAAIASMNEASLHYKGLYESKDNILQWLLEETDDP